MPSSRLRLLVTLWMSCLYESRTLHKAAASVRLMPASTSMQSIQRFLWQPLLLEPLVMPTTRSFSKSLSFHMQCPKKRILNRHILASSGSGLWTLSNFAQRTDKRLPKQVARGLKGKLHHLRSSTLQFSETVLQSLHALLKFFTLSLYKILIQFYLWNKMSQ